MMPVPPEHARTFRRLALANVLVVVVGLVHGLDVAMIVALSLAVMEIDAHVPSKEHFHADAPPPARLRHRLR